MKSPQDKLGVQIRWDGACALRRVEAVTGNYTTFAIIPGIVIIARFGVRT